jgi:hypothetical protein
MPMIVKSMPPEPQLSVDRRRVCAEAPLPEGLAHQHDGGRTRPGVVRAERAARAGHDPEDVEVVVAHEQPVDRLLLVADDDVRAQRP